MSISSRHRVRVSADAAARLGVMCIALVVMSPVVIGFFFLQRWLIEGVNLTRVSR